MADATRKRRGAGSAPKGQMRQVASAQDSRDTGIAKKPRAKEGATGKILCPVCDAALDLDRDELGLFNRVRCEECEALLEVVDEEPVRLEWVEEDDDFEDDEDLDADEEEEDSYF